MTEFHQKTEESMLEGQANPLKQKYEKLWEDLLTDNGHAFVSLGLWVCGSILLLTAGMHLRLTEGLFHSSLWYYIL